MESDDSEKVYCFENFDKTEDDAKVIPTITGEGCDSRIPEPDAAVATGG